jgi:hypothetical protein
VVGAVFFVSAAMSERRLVQNRIPTRSSVSFLIVSRVRASFRICTPFLPSAAGMS